MASGERSERNRLSRGSEDRGADRRQRRVLQETLQEPVQRPKQKGRSRQRQKAEHKAKHRFAAALVEVARVAISLDQIKQLTRNPRQEYADAFSKPSAAETLAVYGILDNPLRLCHFLAQVMTETGALKTLSENLDYSATRLMEVWPRHFRTMQQAEAYAHNPEKLGNFIYGETSIAQALGNNQPGDGFKYRGRGLLQITGRGAYTRYGERLGIDLLNDPDLAFSPEHCLSVAGVEWGASGFHGKTCNELADQDNLEGVTYAINGGQNGIDDRRLWLRRAKSIWFPERAIAEAVFPNLPFGHLALASRGLANIAAEVKPEAAGDFAGRAVQIATTEWVTFGNQTYDIHGNAVRVGHKEGEDPWYLRIGTYWKEGVNNDTLNGRDNVAWSAAFISWVMRTAGAGNRFVYSPQHSIYIYRATRDLLQNRTDAGYWCYRLQEWKPQLGDIVCWGRQAGIDYDHQDGGNYKGHSDIVVEARNDSVEVIGGNVGNSVTRRPLALNAQGFLIPVIQHGENLFGIMRCRL